MENVDVEDTTTTFEFPTKDIPKEAPMKNSSLSSLLNIHGVTSEDPNIFLFKFGILC